jgi:hypothetical protein
MARALEPQTSNADPASNRSAQANSSDPRAWLARHADTLWVYLGQLVFVGVLYAPVLGFHFMADAWNRLEQAQHGFFNALLMPVGAHYRPVANVFCSLQWGLFGANPTAWAVAHLALLAALGTALQRLGTRLLGSAPLAFLASLVFLSNASFHEVSMWPVTGGVLLLAGLLVVLALLATASLVEQGPSLTHASRSAWRLAAWVSAAYFTDHGTLPVLFLIALWLVWARLRAHDLGPLALGRLLGQRAEVAFLSRALLPLGVVLVAASIAHLYLDGPAPAGPNRAYWLVRGLLSVFSLHGSHDWLHALLTFGANSALDSAITARCIAGWLLVGLVGALLALRKGSLGVGLLALWLVLQAAYVGASQVFVPRQALLLALPAALLTLHAVAALGRRLAAPGPFGLAAFATLLLVAGAQRDIAQGLRAYAAASLANRVLVDVLRAEFPLRAPGNNVTLVNLPAALIESGIGAHAFGHGVDSLVRLSLPGHTVELQKRSVKTVTPAGHFAGGSTPMGLAELRAQLADPGHLVVLHDQASRLPRVLTSTSLPTPDSYTASSAPYLDWQAGAWPWLSVLPSQPFDLPLRSDGGRRFGALRYLARPTTQLLVKVAGQDVARVEPDSARGERWAVMTFPMPASAAAEGEAVVTLDSASGLLFAHLFSFAPPASYTPASAQFLPWTAGAPNYTVIEHETVLPLDRGQCVQSCALRVDLLAERGRDVSVSLGAEGQALPLSFEAESVPSWKAYRVPLPDGSAPIALHLRRTGPQPVFLSVLRIEG